MSRTALLVRTAFALIGLIGLSGLIALVACESSKPTEQASAQASAGSSTAARPGVRVNVGPTVRAMAVNPPTPPPNARRVRGVGQGALAVNTSDGPTDTDEIWTTSIDIEGNGSVEACDVLWDDEDKVLLIHGQAEYVCEGGGMGRGEVLIALNASGNRWGRPAGSGYWAALVDEGDCQSGLSGIWACRFDAQGNATECGWATVSTTTGDVVFTEGFVPSGRAGAGG